MPVEVGRPGMAPVFVMVPVLSAHLSRKGFSFRIAGGMVPVGVQVLVEMGMVVLAVSMNVLVFMLMAMGVLMANFHL